MIPNKLLLDNWQSFRGHHEISIPRGLVQIRGMNLDEEGADSNRSGKTSILNALSVCLHGKSPLVARSAGFVTRGEKWGSVGIDFGGPRISRNIRHPKFGNSVFLDGCDKPVEQYEVDKRFGGFHSFISTCFFGTNYSDFLEKILHKPKEARDLLTSLLPKLQIFDLALEWVKANGNEGVLRLRDLAVTESNLMGKLESLRSRDFSERKDDFEKKRKSTINELNGKIKSTETELSAMGKLPNADKLFTDLEAISKEIDKCNSVLYAADIDLASDRSKIVILDRQVVDKNKRLETVLSTNNCPECGQPLPKKSGLSDGYRKERDVLLAEKFSVESTIKEKESKRNRLNSKSLELGAKKRELQSKLLPMEKATKLRESLGGMLRDRDLVMGELNPYIEMEKNARESMASIRRELSALLDEKKSLEDNSPYWEFLAKGFGARGIKNFVFDEIVFALTEMSQSYLDHMTGGTMQIRFDPRKENKGGGFVEAIGLEVTQNGEPLDDFLLWSQGERKRVGLAVDLAMNQLLSEMFGSSLEFLVFDEAFDGLDKTGVEMFCGLLRKHLKRVPQILVVSHSPYSADLFDSEIVVVKEGGFSRVLPADRPDPRKSSLPRLE